MVGSVLARARANLRAALDKLRTDAARRAGKHPKRLPQQVPPFAVEAAYAKGLVTMVRRARRACADEIREMEDVIEKAREARGADLTSHQDAGGNTRKLKALVEAAKRKMADAIKPSDVRALAMRHGKAAAEHNKAQLRKQVKAGMGVDPTFRDKHLPEQMAQWAHRNAGLITSIPPRLGGQIEGIVMDAVARSTPNARVGAEIAQRFDIEERHARLIARDQIGKLVSQVNHSRQRALGITSFIWRTVEDERVRESHQDLDGGQYDYDDPPDGDDGPALPGDDICCRCYAEPVIEDPEDDGEDDDEDGDDEGEGGEEDDDSGDDEDDEQEPDE